MVVSINRCADHEYYVRAKGSQRDVLFSVDKVQHENEYYLVEAVAKEVLASMITTGAKTANVTYHDRTWKVERMPKLGLIQKVVCKTLGLVHEEAEKTAWYLKISGGGKSSKLAIPHELKELREHVPDATDEQLRQGVRKVSTFTKVCGAFGDPFTEVAAHAFAHGYESNYSAKDDLKPGESDCRIVACGSSVLLIAQNNSALCTPVANKATLLCYRTYLDEEFGADKVAQVEKAYGLNFAAMQENGEPLTPEHVYRMNIGLQYVDFDDVVAFFEKLPQLKKILNNVPDDKDISSKELSKATGIPHRILRSLQNEVSSSGESGSDTDSGEEASVGFFVDHLQGWLYVLGKLPTDICDCSETQLQDLMGPFFLDEQAFERALTGRKIRKPLQSGYSTAELGKEKLWVDHQELSQVFEVMRKTNNWDLWLEKLDHIVVKANLLKGNSVDGYRISALVPAPLSDEGHPRWYKVTRCISNGYGVFTYTLEPAVKTSKLPGIFAARSTASSEYALHGTDSLLNDLNALNPPGYEGQVLNSQYDAAFFKEHTMPIWVGHAMHAKKLLETDKDAAYSALRRANLALKRAFEHKLVGRSLGELVREYDWLLNRIGIELPYGDLVTKYLGIYKRIMWLVRGEPQDAETKDAEELCRQLTAIKCRLTDPHVLAGVDQLIAQLEHYLIKATHSKGQGEILNQFFLENFRELDSFEGQAYLAYQHKYSEQIPKLLQDWSDALHERAKNLNELLEHKNHEGLIVTGQSLGGAITQVTLCRQLVKTGRIPISMVHAYTISSPGIRHLDQEAFLEYACDTKEMREAIGSKLKVTHLTEAGDVVFLAGEGHLGAAHDADEAEKVAKSLDMRVEVRELFAGTMEYTTVHETQFMEGKQGIHYDLHTLTSQDLAKIDDAKHVIARNKSDEKVILAHFEAHKKRFKYPKLLDGDFLNKIPQNSLLIKRHLHQKRGSVSSRSQLDAQGVFTVGI